MGEVDVVEGLDDGRVRQSVLEVLRSRDLAVVELVDVAVTLPVVVGGVDDRLARQRFGGDVGQGAERDADDHDVAGLCGLGRGGGAGVGSECRDQRQQGAGFPRVGQDNLVATLDGETCDSCSDKAGADDSDCAHFRRNSCGWSGIPGSPDAADVGIAHRQVGERGG